ncbi:MAG: DUF116 domain-containing protein [Methanotrichaceae archaeon]|nr:DUF116 domain-containing protein [Methanotrichaceae archaeon]
MLTPYVDQFFYFVGEAVVFLCLFLLFGAAIAALLILYSFRTGHFFAASLMLVSISVLESAIKAIFRLGGADDSIVDEVGVRLRNYINRRDFLRIPILERFIFIPQCLRSTECPAKLTPEGIACIGCGRCDIGEAKKLSEKMGYKLFIVPGSSFIKRIIKKYRPRAIIGVGCQMEIKEGLDLCHRYGLPAVGVPLLQNGCVSTKLDWDQFYDTLSDQA